MRRVTIGLLCVLMASGCASGPTGPQRYTVGIDAPSPEGQKLQFSAYFPGRLVVEAGDTITFTNRSTEAPHTITFGVRADRKNQPRLLTQSGENPVAFGKCFRRKGAKPNLTKCDTTTLPDYLGVGYWNSGVLQPASAPADAGPKSVTVKLSDELPADEFVFVCVLHPFMNGLVVVGRDEINVQDRISPDAVTDEANETTQKTLEAATDVEVPAPERNGDIVTLSAGWGDRVLSVNRFAPATIEVRTGTTVRWVGRSPYEPHTITFASPYREPADPRSLRPGGVKSGSEYSGGFANSGLLGPPGGPFPSEPFVLKFTKARSYNYVCTLHPGMNGVVVVR